MSALEMLITYTGERTLIEETDVEEVVGKTKEDTVFDLTGALADKNLQKALSSLKDLFDQGVNHILILSMIAREIRFLLHAKAFIKSGKIAAFHQNMDYDEFHKTVYPVMQALMNDKGKKGKQRRSWRTTSLRYLPCLEKFKSICTRTSGLVPGRSLRYGYGL